MSDSWLAVGWARAVLWVLTSSRLAWASSQEGSHSVPQEPQGASLLLSFVNILFISKESLKTKLGFKRQSHRPLDSYLLVGPSATVQ